MKASVSEASKKAQAALCHLEMWHRAACVISYFIRRFSHVVSYALAIISRIFTRRSQNLPTAGMCIASFGE